MSKYEVTFNQNVKLGRDIYRKGNKVTVNEADLEALTDVIEADYEEIKQELKEPKTVEDMTVSELKDYADKNEIDFGDAKKRDDLLAAIQEFEAKK